MPYCCLLRAEPLFFSSEMKFRLYVEIFGGGVGGGNTIYLRASASFGLTNFKPATSIEHSFREAKAGH